MNDPAAMRVSYTLAELDESQLAPTPLAQWNSWWEQAAADAQIIEPNAMSLATVGPDGLPSVRTVLLKSMDAQGLVFYTNLTSRKSSQLLANPQAAAAFTWLPLHRQVSVRGPVEAVDRADALAYFQSRPYESRLGAWASEQSQEIASRDLLEDRMLQLGRRWPDTGSAQDVPLPDHWGGWRIRPLEVEFWQGRTGRLHDRLVYVPAGTDAAPALDEVSLWRIVRRCP